MLFIITIKLFLVLVYIVNENLSADIYISLNGKDTAGCGNKTTMCQSLQHALQQTKQNDVTIHLDGGSLKPFVYIQNKTIVYDGKIMIKQMAGSIYKPTIQGDERFTDDYVYIIEFPSVPNLEIDSIRFRQILLVRFNKMKEELSSGKIIINNCRSDISNQEGGTLIDNGPSGFISITIDNWEIFSEIPRYLINNLYINELELSIRNSYIYGCSILFSSEKGRLNINNTVFTDYYLEYPERIISVESGDEVNLSNVGFIVPRGTGLFLFIEQVKKVEISQCYWKGSWTIISIGIGIIDVYTLIITDCIFVDIRSESIIQLSDIMNVTINNCYFERLDKFSIEMDNCSNVCLRNNRFEDIFGIEYDVELSIFSIRHAVNVKVVDTHFISCSSPITISDIQLMNIVNSDFMENDSQKNSAINCKSSILKIMSSNFTKNRARKGAAINAINCTLEISRSHFIENNAESAGTFYFDSNTKASLSNVDIISPVDNIPLFATIIESANITTFENVNITILNTTDSVDMLMFDARIKGRLNYSCPFGRKVSIARNEIWKCMSCVKGKYSLKSGAIYFENNTYNSSQDIGCKDCPLGGTCNHGIFSRGNFWGYTNNNGVIFIPCLEHYCCDNVHTVCTSISTCHFKREGRLCGKCLPKHYIDFFTNECFPTETCHRSTEFWCIFIVAVITFFILLVYFKDILKLIKIKVLSNSKYKKIRQLENTLEEPLMSADVNIEKIEIGKEKVTGQGILKILINFYQLNMLINVPMHIDSSTSNILSDIVQALFTLKLTIKKLSSSFCPMENLNAIMKLFIKDLAFVLLVLLLITFLSTVFYIVQLFKKWKQVRLNASNRNIDSNQESNGQNDLAESSNTNQDMIDLVQTNNEEIPVTLPFNVRCKVCMLQVFLIGYTNIATFTLQMLNCVKIKDDYYLYISAEELCLADWQYGVIMFLVCWVLPFSLTLYLSTLLLRDNRITVNEFIICLIFPPTLVCLYLTEKYGNSINRPSVNNESTHILSVLQGSFRKNDGETQTLWDPVILFRRFVIIALVTVLINPIPRLCCVFFIFVLYLFHHDKVLPYRMSMLNNLESFCLLNLCFLTCVNLFRAFVYVYSLPVDQLPMNVINETFNIYEFILMTSPITLTVFYILWLISMKLYGKLHQLCIKKNN